ncbi:hypothetical protein WJX81_006006 [Elliptochloris bilobata]|uniref:Ribosomal RNA-processing protein 12-like conserved domain-containing protein n=1 Tax=Elliptochloris bilobata TaxID=381761 RepID=A0AAW1SGP8_9CHLO
MAKDAGFTAELLAKHRNSAQPESRQLCAVLGAILEVLSSEGLQPTPTAVFAAVMSSLEKVESSPEVLVALCGLLSAALGRVPTAVLRSKFLPSSNIVCAVIHQNLEQAAVVKAALAALSAVAAAADPRDWPAAASAFGLLLRLATDARPKVRRRAQEGAVEALAALQGTPALAPGSAAVLKVCEALLPRPEAAARAAAAASAKRRAEAEGAVAGAVADALHLLGALRQLLPLLAAPAAAAAAELVTCLYALRQPLLSRHATDALSALAGAPGGRLPAPDLASLLGAVMAADGAWERRQPDTLLSSVRLLEVGLLRLHELDAQAAAAALRPAAHALAPLLGVEHEGVRLAASEGLHRSAWPAALPVAACVLSRLGPRGAPLAGVLLQRLGALAAAAVEADEAAAEGDSAPEAGSGAAASLGAALAALGPEAVLAELPLELEEALDGRAEGRPWLLPLLRQYVSGTRLGFWARELLPLARRLGARAAASAGGPGAKAGAGAMQLAALRCRALEAQLWAALPAFASWPLDGAEAFKAHAQEIAAAFRQRADLQPPICTALQRVCLQTRAALIAAGRGEGLGFSEPESGGGIASEAALPGSVPDREDEDDASDGVDGAREELGVPPHFTVGMAEQLLAALRAYAKNWLPELFNAFVEAPAGRRAALASAVSAYAIVADTETLARFFRGVLGKLLKASKDAAAGLPALSGGVQGGTTPSEQRCAFLELALAMGPGLDARGVGTLFRAALPGLQERDQAVQKRAYRVLAYVCARRADFTREHLGEVLEALLAGMATSLSAAKRYRLHCLQAAVLLLLAPDAPAVSLDSGANGGEALNEDEQRKQLVATLVSEIVLCVKEVNIKTRAAAYALLVGLAHAMHAADPPPDPALLAADAAGDVAMDGGASGGAGAGGLHTLFAMVLGGLVGASPHMVSASVMALARLLHEFAPQLGGATPALLPAVLTLLRSRSREVVKAVLGFVKVCAIRLPVEVLQAHLGAMLEGLLLWSEDSKNKFRLKVRVIVERLARRLGFDDVAAAMPAGDKRLLQHIRREALRKQRLRASAGSQAGDEGGDVRSRAARTARASEWAHSRVFSDDEETGIERNGGGQSAAAPSVRGRRPTVARGGGQRGQQVARRLRGSGSGGDPLDLLSADAPRALIRAGAAPAEPSGEEGFARGEGGRWVINEERDAGAAVGGKRKRRPGGGLDDRASDDSDFDDLRARGGRGGGAAGASAKSVRFAGSTAGRSTAGRSTAARSRGGSASARSAGARSRASNRSQAAGSQHSGERFRARKGGAGGDVKGSSRVEPYAYWPLDRKLLNRRPGKKAAAEQGLQAMVHTAKGAKGARGKGKRRKVQGQ